MGNFFFFRRAFSVTCDFTLDISFVILYNQHSKMDCILHVEVTDLEKVPSMYVIGVSRTDSENPITKRYSAFYMVFEVDEAGIVVDFGCTHTLAITERFLNKLFLGRSFLQLDDTLEKELASRYSGTSRKAILIAYRDARKRYQAMRAGE